MARLVTRLLVLVFFVCVAMPAAAFAQVPFSYIVTPPPGAKMATPPAQIRANSPGPGQPRLGHDWYVMANDTGILQVTLVDTAPDGVKATVFDAANAPVGAIAPIVSTFAHETRGSVTVAATPNAVYRVRVDPSAAPGPGLCACPDYYLEFAGAIEAGLPTPTPFNMVSVIGPPTGDHGDGGSINWRLNVGTGESLDLRFGPTGDGSTAPNLRVVLIDAADHVRLDERVTPPAVDALPREIHLPDAGNTPGAWTMAIWSDTGGFPNGPYRVFRLSGADRALYVAWDTDGQGGLDVSIVQGAAPSATPFEKPVDILVTDLGGFAEVKTVTAHVSDPDNSVSLRKLHVTPPAGWTATPADYNLFVTYDATAFLTIRVQDLTAPTLTLPGDINVAATSAAGATVSFNVSATDLDDVLVDAPVTCTSASGSVFPIGQTTVTCTATDARANTTTGTFRVTVTDAAVCSAARASVVSIWPPNHKLVDISVLGVTTASGQQALVTITGIFQDEATDAEGDGKTAIDGFGVGTSRAHVRAERSGTGDGRVYHIGFTATVAAGASCTGAVTVGVPHDQGTGPAVDGGALFDSTVASAPPAVRKQD
jgi:hypothetical protein